MMSPRVRRAQDGAPGAFYSASSDPAQTSTIFLNLRSVAENALWRIPTLQSQAMAAMAQRSMQLQATIQEGQLMLGDGTHSVVVECLRWK